MITASTFGLPDSLAGAVIGGAIGLVGGWIAASKSATSAFTLAREQRRQERWEAAYIELVTYLNRWDQLAGEMDSTNTAISMPGWANDDELHRVQARVEAFASDPVKKEMEPWFAARNALRFAYQHKETLLNTPASPELPKARIDVSRTRMDLENASAPVKAEIVADLRGS